MIHWLIFALMTPQKVDITEARALFTQIGRDEIANEQLFTLTAGYTMNYKPLVYGYHAASIMTKANYCFWPLDKWNYFKEGKNKLESVIHAYPDLLELKYIRYAVQKSSPSFLGYNDKMDSDKKELFQKMDDQSWPHSFIEQVKKILNQP